MTNPSLQLTSSLRQHLGMVAVVLAIGAGVVFYLHRSWQAKLEGHYSEQQAILDTAYRASLQMYRLVMNSYFHNLLNNSRVQGLIAEAVDSEETAGRDIARGKLYRLLYNSYEAMRKDNLMQLHFHLADGRSFLRFYQPERFDDLLFDARPGVFICNTEKKAVQGFESGKVRSGFRYLFPLFFNERHLGSVEVSVTVKSILQLLKDLDPQREYAFILRRGPVEAHLFEEQRWLYSTTDLHDGYVFEDEHAVLPDSPSPLSAEAKRLNQEVRSYPGVRDAMDNVQPLTVSARLSGGTYTVSLLPIKDISGQPNAYLLTYVKDPLVGQLAQEFYTLLLFGLAGVGLIVFLFGRLRVRTAALDAERQNLQAMNDALAEGVYVQERRGTILTSNPAACQLLGYSLPELLGKQAHDLFHRQADGSTLPPQQCHVHQYLEKGQPYDGEEYFLARDGRLLQVELASRPIFQHGQVVGSVTAFHDITERKEIEAALRRSEETSRKLVAAVEQSSASVVITNEQGIIEFVNQKFCQVSGYAASEAIGQTPRILKSGQIPDEVYRQLWLTISAGQAWKGELQNRHKDGSLYWEFASISPIRNADGCITHFIAVKEDISDRLRMEQELRDSELVQRTLMESLPVGLVIIDQQTRLIENVNPFAEQLFGAGREKILGHTCHNFLCPAQLQSCPISDFGQKIDNSDREMIQADGARIAVLKTVRTVSIKGREKLLECFVDIRERKKAEDSLRQANAQLVAAIARAEKLAAEAAAANKAKSDFLASMSHEIRTPMNAVLGMTHLALRTELTAQQRDFLEKADRSARSLLGLLNEILDLSKVEAGRLELERIPFSLHEVLETVSTVISTRIADKDIELVVGTDHDVPTWLTGDPLRLGQVLINLAGNAAKFTEEGEVSLRVRMAGQGDDGSRRLEFIVSDTGVGLDPEQQRIIFQPFTQADASTTRTHGGTGLGLSISQRLVHLMGGSITVGSTPGLGSSFNFEANFMPVPPPAYDAATSAAIRSLRVLIVDDKESARRQLGEYLQQLDIAYTAVDSGQAALACLRGAEPPYSLVMTDRKMPELDGIQLAAAIFADPSVKPLSVILMSVFGREEMRHKAVAAGCFACLAKPVVFRELVQLLEKAAGHSASPAGTDSPVRSMERPEEIHFAGCEILLVEDNEFNQQVAAGILENAGLKVELATDGKEAVRLAEEKQFALILMDIQMPIMDGFTATRLIRKLSSQTQVPIVAMTAYAGPEVLEKVKDAGMDDHIAKPIDLRRLFAVLGRWLPPAVPVQMPIPAYAAMELSEEEYTPVEMVEQLEALVPVLQACRPKTSRAAVAALKLRRWPSHRQDTLRKIEKAVAAYEFMPAVELVNGLLISLRRERHA